MNTANTIMQHRLKKCNESLAELEVIAYLCPKP